jgi:hypothetical protein
MLVTTVTYLLSAHHGFHIIENKRKHPETPSTLRRFSISVETCTIMDNILAPIQDAFEGQIVS